MAALSVEATGAAAMLLPAHPTRRQARQPDMHSDCEVWRAEAERGWLGQDADAAEGFLAAANDIVGAVPILPLSSSFNSQQKSSHALLFERGHLLCSHLEDLLPALRPALFAFLKLGAASVAAEKQHGCCLWRLSRASLCGAATGGGPAGSSWLS